MMSSAAIKSITPSKQGHGGLSAGPPSSQTILLDKFNARTATPDSEALASSDDENDCRVPLATQTVPQPPRPVRRASWLTDTSQQTPKQRKGSFASSTMSPTTSHPGTPSAETGSGPWGSHSASAAMMNRPPGSFPWGTGIWNSDRKEPSRLSEVLPSPTSAMPPGGPNSIFSPESLGQTSPAPREQGGGGPTSQIPFAIPLHPTPKTYRSQSYSVGQMDPDPTPASMSQSTILGRARPHPHPHPGIQHRPSRPSMLSEMSESGLGKLNEIEDDDESPTESLQNSQHQSVESKTIEMLTRENAMLRQQQQQYHNRIRPRSSTAAVYGMGNGYAAVPEESDYAIDELDESNDSIDALGRKPLGRRLSEFGAGAGAFRSPFGNMDSRKLDSVKKGLWQSQLGFGGLGDGPQSRRHSFADVPARQPSISSIADSAAAALEMNSQDGQNSQDYPAAFGENTNFALPNPAEGPASHFSGAGNMPPGQMAHGQSPYNNLYPQHYAAMHAPYGNRAPSPHRNVYGMAQPRQNQLLHIVYFKCSRADVFYIQEGTGLTVKPGDLVIVEADRGTDIGTVVRDNVDWQSAKDLKEYYGEEHYKWLMMYSQNASAVQDGTAIAMMAPPPLPPNGGMQPGAMGGLGGPHNQHHGQEPNTGELKPKLIKRLAQSHEIHALRDKEGNEAKAKRVCMQKVKEHGLNMEILDAEFQMDWKKLTFYYFADAYINFNSLVTDLFKIYKTRIWMSAVNPASFANPTLGLQAPSGIGPGAVGVGRGTGNAERRQNQPQQDVPGGPPAGRGMQPGAFGQGYGGVDRGGVPTPSYITGGFPYQQPPQQQQPQAQPGQQQYGGGFGSTGRGGGGGGGGAGAGAGLNPSYMPGTMGPSPDSYGAFAAQNDYLGGARRFPNQPPSGNTHGQGMSPVGAQPDWVSNFQGLSLNSR